MADLIERSAAIDAICELHTFGKDAVFGEYNENSYAEHLHDAVKAVEEVEAVDAVPVRHGRWKEDSGGWGFWICSCCRFTSEASCADVLYHYCPNCGAKMEVEHGRPD